MKFLSIFFVLLLLALVLDSLDAAKPKGKGAKKKKPHSIRRDAEKKKTTGPCESDGTCANPKDVCEKKTGNCFPKGTPGLGTFGSSTGNCEDKSAPGRGSDCPSRAYLCSNNVYYQLMTEQCPKTCNRCPK